MEFKELSTGKKNGKNSCEYIVLHHTAMGIDKDGKQAARYLSGPQGQGGMVSVHFVVGQDGTIWKIGELTDRLWHAGDSEINYLGITDWNSHSIGIEIDSNGYNYSTKQIEATNQLVCWICKECNLGTEKIIRHADLTKRKWDVGPNFFLYQDVKDLEEYRTKIDSILIGELMGEYEKLFKATYPDGSTVFSDLEGAGEKISTFKEMVYFLAIGLERVKK